MKVVFRVDASIKIGTGHVMRCLTLADALSKAGVQVSFICRRQKGHLIDLITRQGFAVHVLAETVASYSNPLVKTKPNRPSEKSQTTKLFHSDWLLVSQIEDAEDCQKFLEFEKPDWLIVDHYAIDQTWQNYLRPYFKQLMVIDDLADRKHICDVLLDQNYGSTIDRYQSLVPKHCQQLIGTEFAMLRPEFTKWREISLKHRAHQSKIETLLISMGGVDSDNYTGKLLQQLNQLTHSSIKEIMVVMGPTAPYLESVKKQAQTLPFKTHVKTNVTNMAQMMAQSDLAIGAAGATTWERCCLGLPTIQMVIAANQRQIARALHADGVVLMLEAVSQLSKALSDVEQKLDLFMQKSSSLVDGAGVKRVSAAVKFGAWPWLNGNRYQLLPYQSLSQKQSLQVLDMRNHQMIRKWMRHREIISPIEHFRFIDALRNALDKRFFLVCESEKTIGVINFTQVDPVKKRAEFGVFANPHLKEKGNGTKLVALALDYAQNTLRLNELRLEVFAENQVAINLYTKFGFQLVDSSESFLDCSQNTFKGKVLVQMIKKLDGGDYGN